MKRLTIFAALTAAGIGLTALPSPADAGGRRAYCPCVCTSDGGVCGRDCGRHCDRSPYGGGYGQGGYGGGQILTVEEFDHRIHFRERTRTKIRIRIYHD